jgi:Zn-dependent protease with chaperone function
MPELCPLVAALTFAYLSALIGVGYALLMCAWFRRGMRTLTTAEASLCVWAPPLAVVAMLAVSWLPVNITYFFGSLHYAWHAWADSLSLSPSVHSLLHSANNLLLLCAGVALTHTVFVFARMRALANTLRSTSAARRSWNGLEVFCLDAGQPICFTLGLFRPCVYVSIRLLERLSPRHQEVMFAHEAAHVRRRDGLVNAILCLFYHLLPLPGGSVLLGEWRRAAERACDAEAARHLGDPCDVAEALVEVARLVQKPFAPGAAFFATAEDIEGRVKALLALPGSRRTSVPLLILGVLLLASCTFMGQPWIYHLVELFVYH